MVIVCTSLCARFPFEDAENKVFIYMLQEARLKGYPKKVFPKVWMAIFLIVGLKGVKISRSFFMAYVALSNWKFLGQ